MLLRDPLSVYKPKKGIFCVPKLDKTINKKKSIKITNKIKSKSQTRT